MEPYINENDEEIIRRNRFGGLNRRYSVAEDEFSEAFNTTDEYYPAIGSRGTRTGAVYNVHDYYPEQAIFNQGRPSAAVSHDSIGLLSGMGWFFYNFDYCNTGCVDGTLLRIGNRFYVKPHGVIIDLGTYGTFAPDQNGTLKYSHVRYYTQTQNSYKKKHPAWVDNPYVTVNFSEHFFEYAYTITGKVYNDGTLDIAHNNYLYMLPGRYTADGGVETVDTDGTVILLRGPQTSNGKTFDYIDEGDVIHVTGQGYKTVDGNQVTVNVDTSYVVAMKLRRDASGTPYDILVLSAGIDRQWSFVSGSWVVEKRMPPLDHIFEHNGRLWGCRYGIGLTGEFVNEIYCTALNNLTCWERYNGTSMDSWTVSLAAEGAYTGAGVVDGYPTFFRETCCHRVSGDYPANFSLDTIECEGIQHGCADSLINVNGSTYYKSSNGIVRFSGGFTQMMSQSLGHDSYFEAAAESDGRKIYMMMEDTKRGDKRMYVFDTETGLWHTEDVPEGFYHFMNFNNRIFAFCGGTINPLDDVNQEIYHNRIDTIQEVIDEQQAIIDDPESTEEQIAAAQAALDAANADKEKALKDIVNEYKRRITLISLSPELSVKDYLPYLPAYLIYSQTAERDGFRVMDEDKDHAFKFVTGPIGYDYYTAKYLNRMTLRMEIEKGASCDIDIVYDDDKTPKTVRTLTGDGRKRVYSVPVRPIRCDHFELIFSGRGEVKLLDETLVFASGSEHH